jgi:hypothetical protein
MINDLLKKRFTTRFWDNSKEVPYELIQSVLQDVYDSPRKNGDAKIIVKVLTPSDAGEKMKDELLKLSWCRDGDKGAIDNTGPIRVQGQFTAPYVLLFGTKEEVDYDQHNVANATLQTTIAMVSAEEKGLNTAYCQCIEPDESLESDVNFFVMSGLGIGYAATPIEEAIRCPIDRVTIVEDEVHYDTSNVIPGYKYFGEREKPELADMSIII